MRADGFVAKEFSSLEARETLQAFFGDEREA